jgi:hypothetical protein
MDALQNVLARGMQENPSARYTTALAFASALEAAARGEVTPPAAAVPLAAPATAEPAVNPLTAAAAISAVPAAVSAATSVPAGHEDDDDVLNEKDEDEAHHQLSLQESEEADSHRPDLQMDEDIEAEAEADRFMFEVAGRAANADVGQTVSADVSDDLHRAATPVYHPTFGPSAAEVPPAREASSMRPLVVGLVIGLLAGLGGGYALWGRSTPASESTSAASSAAKAPPTGREFSEQAVNPPPSSTRTPPAGTPPAAKSSAPGSSSTPVAPPAPRSGSPESAEAVATPPVRATAGTIVVRSSPSGAGVRVNGGWRGRTPLTLEKLPLGRYDVRVVQDGYAPATEAISLTAGAPSRSLSFRLLQQARPSAGPVERRPATPSERSAAAATGTAFTGSIFVDSRPRGARVSIDGRPVGVTPLRVPEIRIGTRIVRLELPDYRIWSSTARVAAGQEVRVTGSLERIQ